MIRNTLDKTSGKMAKLALESDSNIVGESFIIQPDKSAESKLGALFGVVEAYNINDAFLDGFLAAISDLKTEYYLPPFNVSRGVEKRFEEAISRANRRIYSAISQSVDEVDLRNVSAAVGLLYGNRVYLSSAGRIKALFFRRKKSGELFIIDILSGNGEARYRPEPEKVFANILSGDLSPKDALLMINEEFLGFFSQKELGEITLGNSSDETQKILSDSLREKIAKKNFYAVVLAPDAEQAAQTSSESAAPAPEAAAAPAKSEQMIKSAGIQRPRVGTVANPIYEKPERKGPQTQQSIDKLLFTQVKTEKYLTPSLLPSWQKILLIIWNNAKIGSAKLAALAKQGAIAAISAAKKAIESRNGKPSNKPTTPAEPGIEEIRTPQNANAEPAAEPVAEAGLEIDGEPSEENCSEMTEIRSSGETETEREYGDDEAGYDNQIQDQPYEEPQLLTEEIKVERRSSGIADRVNGFLNAQIENFLGLKRGQQAILVSGLLLIFLFSQSVVMIGRAADKSSGSSANDSIAQQIEYQLNAAEAQSIYSDDVGAVAAIKKARELLATIPDRRSTKTLRSGLQAKIDNTAGILQKIKRLDSPAVIADFSSQAATSSMAGLAKTGKVFWAFDNSSHSLLRFDTATGKLTVATTSLPDVKKLSAIDDKNLITQVSGGYEKYEIAKRANTKTKPSKDYFQLKLPTAVSPLIDPPLASSTIDMSIASDSYLFFLDGKDGRVIVLDKNGALKRQYYSESFNGASSMAASSKEKKIWIYNGGKAFQIDFDF